MTINLSNTGIQHFNGSGADTVNFGRTVVDIYVHTTASTTISFDGGSTFMTLPDSTMHTFKNIRLDSIAFGAGTWSGVGISY